MVLQQKTQVNPSKLKKISLTFIIHLFINMYNLQQSNFYIFISIKTTVKRISFHDKQLHHMQK